MYTVRELTKSAADLAATLKKISAMGYPAVQMSGVGAMSGDNPEVDPQTARKMLDDNGLKCVATHRPWPRLLDNPDAEIEFHKTLGCDFTAIGGIPRDYEQSLGGYRQWVEDAKPVITKLKAAGIQFGHHNHAHEFYRPERYGMTLEDVLIDEAPGDLMLELDLYWVEHAGLNCVPLLERCHGRVPVIHLKDKEVVPQDAPRMAPIGEGNMHWDGIIPACEKAGVQWYAVEQDNCYRDPFDCLKSSFDFLTSKGL
jgi:sugar phosphate isomerase/epimerase